ncbi:precorrin-3B C(17)-methyltransferase [Methylomonas rhizoryzae]|uniref:precorrin-3B C(17)-methyltransferase n=1 Tax=Methylomonas rhizoryzae TaxID=2608981 RepID=UPI0012326C17|nr:precorrin-3B C(17)-methyltransferase [Methylomonas rhizoryzae]
MAYILGLGCDRDTAPATLATAVEQALALAGLDYDSVAAVATIEQKRDETAILQLAAAHAWPLHYYGAEQLAQVQVPNPSETVRHYMGTPAVAEAAALLAAQADVSGLILEKHKFRGSDGKHATVSIARCQTQPQRAGKILLVGFGPGAPEHMSFRARAAIAEADVVIGYSTYIKLVEELLAGKQVIRKGMTEELDRSIEAYRHASAGKTVALISSGDIGVYGMAGPTYELLFQAGWTPDSGVAVEVVPGATALTACAALVGAPLTHDFCSISLSDLLTPWPVIARRLEAAARADFVVALYNPKSGRRTRQIVEAQRLLLLHRKPDTPVAVVKSGYRRRQQIQISTLAQMADCEIGMLCTVLIGNSSTFVRHGLLVTPRGYANKYDSATGATKPGEQAGRSLSMGLNGWHAGVRDFLQRYPDCGLRDAAEHFDAPPAQILAALAGPEANEAIGARRADAGQLDAVLAAAHDWGELRAVLRSAGAVAELLLNAAQLSRKGRWLNLIAERQHLHLDSESVADLWFFSHAERQYGVYVTDRYGQVVLSLLLIRGASGWDERVLRHFRHAAEALAHPVTPFEPDAGYPEEEFNES